MKQSLYNLRRRLARYAKILLGRDIYIAKDAAVALERFGVANGGWYLCPVGLSENSTVYSFGVGTNISFDLALIEKYHLVVHCFDPSPQSIEYITSGSWPDKLVFHSWGIGKDNAVHGCPVK